mmetsp:Transcript_5457/g.7378  ORF Transcript_5457/g.7378 Transcript_5457/m.7378 type:complete len:221 (-) Transcript_5457:105-767(-)|eukprot:CAMPEP_0196586250 /NCGR_PEP_ID=MMETSP1081-20130531/53658_1 /TAXON_ID=36882 /ORGANISM="Pyramimonas amylifera, Strain CCMP720" /LENGTH=220 /DNA_ID=CAMNT_0041908065 /DNA_START=110 /DNA_END=772 /DNA_ORIENTATION=+
MDVFSDESKQGKKDLHNETVKDVSFDDLVWKQYTGENELELVTDLIDQELSEPYSVFTYRYFISQWPQLCFMVLHEEKCIGTIVCKMDVHRGQQFRGYIAMLVVDKPYRKHKLGSKLVCKAIEVMISEGVEEVMLEAEISNRAALSLYENLGFIRDKRLHRYYLSGQDAYRLKLLLPNPNHYTYEFEPEKHFPNVELETMADIADKNFDVNDYSFGKQVK